jgi:hypothetical protein
VPPKKPVTGNARSVSCEYQEKKFVNGMRMAATIAAFWGATPIGESFHSFTLGSAFVVNRLSSTATAVDARQSPRSIQRSAELERLGQFRSTDWFERRRCVFGRLPRRNLGRVYKRGHSSDPHSRPRELPCRRPGDACGRKGRFRPNRGRCPLVQGCKRPHWPLFGQKTRLRPHASPQVTYLLWCSRVPRRPWFYP